MTVPAWIDETVPANGPCLICGDTETGARHRLLDSIAEHIRAGDPASSVAHDYGYPVEFCQRLADEWEVTDGSATPTSNEERNDRA